jgi:hypothetical protein
MCVLNLLYHLNAIEVKTTLNIHVLSVLKIAYNTTITLDKECHILNTHQKHAALGNTVKLISDWWMRYVQCLFYTSFTARETTMIT